uniref:Extensin n=1 Tax=Kalanchoe fedtschenkoi TaxID=63787 RepID=A0A7N0TUF3_KALFE
MVGSGVRGSWPQLILAMAVCVIAANVVAAEKYDEGTPLSNSEGWWPKEPKHPWKYPPYAYKSPPPPPLSSHHPPYKYKSPPPPSPSPPPPYVYKSPPPPSPSPPPPYVYKSPPPPSPSPPPPSVHCWDSRILFLQELSTTVHGTSVDLFPLPSTISTEHFRSPPHPESREDRRTEPGVSGVGALEAYGTRPKEVGARRSSKLRIAIANRFVVVFVLCRQIDSSLGAFIQRMLPFTH